MMRLREVGLEDADLILRWRTSERVTKFMNTDIAYDLEAQKKWLSASYANPHYYHWIIMDDEDPVGLISLSDYSEAAGTASWGFYVGEESWVGRGAFVPPHFYNFLFERLKLKRIDAEVFYNNTHVIGLHLLHGYKFSPEKDRVIQKNGKDVLLVAMTLRREDWNAKRFSKSKADFPVELWTARPSVLAQPAKENVH